MNATLFKSRQRGGAKEIATARGSIAPMSGNPVNGAVTLNLQNPDTGERYKLTLDAEACARIEAYSREVAAPKQSPRDAWLKQPESANP